MNEFEYYKKDHPVYMRKSVANITRAKLNQSILDNEDIQEKVSDYIYDLFYHEVDSELCHPDCIENYVNGGGWGFRVWPNIPIIQAFLKKWNKKPFLEGKKWVIILEEFSNYGVLEDAASYMYEFEWGENQSYEFYVQACPETEIKEEDYEDEPFEKRVKRMYDEEEEEKNYLENCTNEELLKELERRYWDERTLDTDEVKETLHLMFDDDGKLRDPRTYDFSKPYHTPFLDYGGDEFQIDPVLRSNPEAQLTFLKRVNDDNY